MNVKKASSIQRVIKSSLRNNQPKAKFETSLKPPRANQTLKQYLQRNSFTRAIEFFRELLRQNPSAVDSYSLVFVLKACTRQSLIVEGQQGHATAKKLGFEPIIFLQTCLIDFYSAVGNVDSAYCVFDEICCKNAICWTSLITAYVDNDMPGKALYMFKKMLMTNLEPDQVTLTVALTACANLGALSMGEWIHSYICRENVLRDDLCLRNAGDDVTLSNIYAAKGLWYEKMMLRCRIRNRRAPGCSSVEVGSEVNEFVAGDSHHPLKAEIYDVLVHLMGIVRSDSRMPEASNVIDY